MSQIHQAGRDHSSLGGGPSRNEQDRPSEKRATRAPGICRVLVIDDEPLVGTTLRILLDDHDVLVVTSGEEAKALMRDDEDFDLVLCDLMLGDLTGMELSRWVQVRSPALSRRLVFMTGGAFTAEAEAFLDQIPDSQRLNKPFTSDELQSLLVPR